MVNPYPLAGETGIIPSPGGAINLPDALLGHLTLWHAGFILARHLDHGVPCFVRADRVNLDGLIAAPSRPGKVRMENPPVSFLKLLPEFPAWWEFGVLVLVVSCLVGGGHLTMRHWHDRNESVPVPVTLMLWVGMFVIYFSEVVLFYRASPDTHKLGILAWCLIFWTIPVTYFTYAIVTSLANSTIDRIGPYSARIEDPSEFASARKLALRGDVDAAVARYRDYRDNREAALFEAARLLKSESRYEEAAGMFAEIARDFNMTLPVWAEATYQEAKVLEVHLGRPKEAMALMRKVLNRAPESRFSQMASADLARLQVLDEDFLQALEGGEVVAPKDPFYARTEERRKAEAAMEEAEDAYPDPPPTDPFFRPHPAVDKDSDKDLHADSSQPADKIRFRGHQEG